MEEPNESKSHVARRAFLGSQVLRTLAALVIVVAGLKLGAEFLVPLLLAAFFAMALTPIATRLRKAGAPAWLAISASFLLALLLIVGIGFLIGDSVSQLEESLPTYEKRIEEMMGDATGWLRVKGVEIPDTVDDFAVDPDKILSLASSLVSGFGSALSNMIVVLMVLLFMLFEAASLPERLSSRRAEFESTLERSSRVTQSVIDYLSVKTVISLLTGLAWGIFLAIVGVDFPVLWGLLAFLLNYVPNVGSVLAAIPPVLLALVQFGVGQAALVGAGSVLVNGLLGNVVEPKMMGSRLGLSVLVVFVGLIFWSWVFGAVGTILSVPLTMVVKMAFEATEDYKDIAFLMGPEPRPEALPPTATPGPAVPAG